MTRKRVLHPECRLSYCNLVTARAPQNGVGDPKFSVTLLIPKSNPNIKQELDAAMNAAAEVGVNAKWNGVRPPVSNPSCMTATVCALPVSLSARNAVAAGS